VVFIIELLTTGMIDAIPNSSAVSSYAFLISECALVRCALRVLFVVSFRYDSDGAYLMDLRGSLSAGTLDQPASSLVHLFDSK
jgi:hypothetical protein